MFFVKTTKLNTTIISKERSPLKLVILSDGPCSLHTNRLSTSVHSSKNLMHSTGILTIGSKFIPVFEKVFLGDKNNFTYLKTSTKERLFLNRSHHVYLLATCNFA